MTIETKPKSFLELATVAEGLEEESSQFLESGPQNDNLHQRQMSVIPEDMDDILSATLVKIKSSKTKMDE